MKGIPNPFIDCSLPELAEAWKVFSAPRKDGSIDTEAMDWIREATDHRLFLHTSIIQNPLGSGSINIIFLTEL